MSKALRFLLQIRAQYKYPSVPISLETLSPNSLIRRLEREHREGTAQDIGQFIAAVGAPMIRYVPAIRGVTCHITCRHATRYVTSHSLLWRLLTPVVVSVAPDFSAGVIEFMVEPCAFTPGDDAVGLGASLIPLDPRLVSFDP